MRGARARRPAALAHARYAVQGRGASPQTEPSVYSLSLLPTKRAPAVVATEATQRNVFGAPRGTRSVSAQRTHALSNFPMLEKMFMERLLRKEEVEAFAASLAAHQKATLDDGSTVLDRAVMEHNMLATSKLYARHGPHIAHVTRLLRVPAAAAARRTH
jgi:hypothetical protein